MAIVVKNLCQTPTFELGSVGGWTATGATLSVSTDKSGLGTKSLKVTATTTGSIFITGAAAPALMRNGYPAYAGIGAYAAGSATNQYTSETMFFGADFLDSGGAQVARVIASAKYPGTTMARYQNTYLSNYSAGIAQIRPVIRWDAINVGESIYIDGITLLQYFDATVLYTPWGSGNTIPDIIGSKAASGNVTYSWEGTAEASYSLATSGASVTVPAEMTRGSSAVITGTGFVPSTSIKLRLANDGDGSGTGLAGFATVTSDGSGAFSYTWPTVVGDQGSRWVAAQPTAGWGALAPTLVKGQVAGTPTRNFAVNPSFRSSSGTARNLFNLCTNPTPTLDLTGWDPVGAATVTRDTAAKIKGISHGARVVSGAATDGITLPGPAIATNWENVGHSAYVRAVTDCTLKISTKGDGGTFTISTNAVGWGDVGWGPDTPYRSGDTITLTAGQVVRARLRSQVSGTSPTFNVSLRMQITGAGTFDVDGVWCGIGVSDGDYPDDASPGNTAYAPGSAPFFCGATPADADFTYEWIGTPYASASARRGRISCGVVGAEGLDPVAASANGTGTEDYNYTHQNTRSDGEPTLALRTKQWFSNGDVMISNASGGTTAADLGLTVGKSYLLSMDIIMDYWAVLGGYAHDGSNGNEFFTIFQNATAQSTQPKISIPGRTRHHSAFNVDTGTEEIILGVPGYMGWLLGEVEITKVMLTETTIYAMGTGSSWTSPLDLSNTGITPGSDILLSVTSNGPGVATPFTIEAQVGGVWTAAGSLTISADDWEMTNQAVVTIPAGATGVRLVGTPSATDSYTITDAPAAYFDGSTAASGGWTYSWQGTADQSVSIRSQGPTGPTAQVFVNGSSTGVAVSEMRVVVSGGSLVPVTEAG